MRIHVKQSGGYAGIPVDLADIDTATLAPPAAQRLEQMVRDVSFFELPAQLQVAREAIGADQLRYEVTVEESGRRHTVSFSEAAPEAGALRNLVTAAQHGG